jgi:hypothetical protein
MSENAIRGLAWPFKFINGSVAVSIDSDNVSQAIMQIIGTDHGEMVMQPDFGCNIHRRVFDPINTLPLVRTDILEALNGENLPIDGVRVTFDDSKGYEGKGLVLVEYSIAGNEFRLQFDLVQFDVVSYGGELAKTAPPSQPTAPADPTPPVY